MCRRQLKNTWQQKRKTEYRYQPDSGVSGKTAFIFDSQDGKPYTFFDGYTSEMLKLISVKNIFAGKNTGKPGRSVTGKM